MTGRATFGDFLRAAHRHLDPPVGSQERGASLGDVEEVTRSLLRAVTIMGRYVQDITPTFDDVPAMPRMALDLGTGAPADGRPLTNAADMLLYSCPTRRRPGSPSIDPLARRLDQVTALPDGRA